MDEKDITEEHRRFLERLSELNNKAEEVDGDGHPTKGAMEAIEELLILYKAQKSFGDMDIKDSVKRIFAGHSKFRPLLQEIAELHDKKNKQYASGEDPLGNFKRGAQACKSFFNEEIQSNIFKLEMAYATILAYKQIDGAMQILSLNKKGTPDSLAEKLRDVITYFCIIDCINSDFEDCDEINIIQDSPEKILKRQM